MGFERGHKKSGGRKPSTPNKRTLKLIEILEEEGYSPVAELIEWADVAKQEFERYPAIIDRFEVALDKALEAGVTPPAMPDVSEQHMWAKIGIQAAIGLLPYVYPKRKPAEGQDTVTPEEAQKMSTDELIAYAEKQIETFKGVKQ